MINSHAADKATVDKFLPDIFDIEAGALLKDAMGAPSLLPLFLMGQENEDIAHKAVERAKAYLVGVLQECYDLGHLKILAHSDGETAYGYALLFAHPGQPELPLYMHKIYVHEQYRGQGMGSAMLTALEGHESGVTLLCHGNLTPFYEARGYEVKGIYGDQPTPDHMSDTAGIYSGLTLMTNGKAKTTASAIFMLNNDDTMNIAKALTQAV